MNTAKSLMALSVAAAMVPSAALCAVQEEDSVYQWGRWAVLSPAAGGEPYVAALTPDAANNARPGEADEFQPSVESVDDGEGPAEVIESCTPGAPCGFATYSRQLGDGSDNGPVLAGFDLTETPPEAPSKITNFSVTDTDNELFPEIDSVDLGGHFSDGDDVSGAQGQATYDPELDAIVTEGAAAVLSHSNPDTGQVYDFDGVNAGYWRQLAEKQFEFINGNSDVEVELQSDSRGYFVQGIAATVEQMEAFAAGRVSASYNGFVLDYASPVALNFNFDSNTFNGNFGTANGFTGFQIDGAVNGINFSATDAGKEVVGSFFNGGLNASGAVNNGSQLGVFSTDYSGSATEASR